MEQTTSEINVERRVALFNIKVRNTKSSNIFKYDELGERELQIERDKLLAILTKKMTYTEAEKLLLKVKKEVL